MRKGSSPLAQSRDLPKLGISRLLRFLILAGILVYYIQVAFNIAQIADTAGLGSVRVPEDLIWALTHFQIPPPPLQTAYFGVLIILAVIFSLLFIRPYFSGSYRQADERFAAQTKTAAVGALVDTVNSRDTTKRVRDAATRSLREIGAPPSPGEVPHLIQVLQDPSSTVSVRASAAEILGMVQGETVVAPLLATLVDTRIDPLLRISAAKALGNQGENVPILELVRVAGEDPERKVQVAAAAAALLLLGKRSTIETLTTTAKSDPDERVRAAAVAALAKLASAERRDEPILLPMPDEKVVQDLQALGYSAGVDRLIEAINN